MKVTVPHMGNLYIVIEALLHEMGHQLILPPPSSRKTLNLGTQYSPETVCLPLKLGVGNILEAIELGADAVLMLGGRGPCRLGYYAALEQEIMADLGKEIKFIILEHPREDWTNFKIELLPLIAKKGITSLIRGFLLAWEKLVAIEKLEKTLNFVRPREAERGTATKIFNSTLIDLRKAKTIIQIRRISKQGNEKLLAVSLNQKEFVPKIGLVGEIYTVLEPFSNLDLEQRLGNLGVEVFRTVSLVQWLKNHFFLSSLRLYSNRGLRKKAEGYLHAFVGGHGLESVANAVMLAEDNYDGIVHLFPFTCMPEIIAQGILQNVSSDHKLPLLTLIVDEQTSEIGFQTRLEAFVDLLVRRKREGEKYGKVSSLSWG